MMTDRKKPGVAFWATVVLVVAVVLYPLAWGPWTYCVLRWGNYESDKQWTAFGLFTPLDRLFRVLPEPIADTYQEYWTWWHKRGLNAMPYRDEWNAVPSIRSSLKE
jgi:hypothetical protein